MKILTLLEEERGELLRLLQGLEPDAWERVTPCDPWTVKDLVAHLLGDDLSFLSRVRDSFTPGGPVPDDWEEFVAWLNDINERWVQAARFMSRELMCDLLHTTGHEILEFFAGVDLAGPGDTVEWAGEGPAPWWLAGGREFTERWIHQQHIREATEKPGLNGPQFVAPVLVILLHGVRRAFADLDAPAGTSVMLDIEGRAGSIFVLKRDEGRWDLFQGRAKEPDALIRLDQDTMWRFLVRNVQEETARSKAAVEGDLELTDRFFTSVSAVVSK